jgi:tetratricopeptide (TPR) repeat protein
MGERAADGLRYTAFLSYSHRDAAAAARLHRRLEAYRMPKRLVGRETGRGPVPERLAPIFRDREELPAATDLSETVREALAGSGALIILCSPNSAGSLWVAEEIKTFREIHPNRPILAAVLDGDPPDCFPAALRAFGRDGTWHEPLATDLRPQRDGMRLGVLKLVAGITGVGLDALVQRDAARRVRRVMAVTIGAVIALLITAALALAALSARREAERQRAEAEGLIEFMLTDLREKLSGVGRLEIMTAVNQRALRYYDHQLALNDRAADSAMRARIKHAIGEDLMARHDWPGALADFREAHRITSSLIARMPNDANAIFAHAQSEYWLGKYAYEQHNLSTARPRFERYKALARRLLAIDAGNPQWLREAGYAEGNICVLDLAVEEHAGRAVMPQSCLDALSYLERAWSVRRNDPSFIEALANRHAYMVDVWSANGRWDLALQHRRRHEELVKDLIRRDPANADYRDIWMRSQFGFGELLAAHGQRREAQARFADAGATAAMLLARDPENAAWRDWQQRIARSAAALSAH